jgi:hypothetical protein
LKVDAFATYASMAIAFSEKSQNCPGAVTFRHHPAFCSSRSLSVVQTKRKTFAKPAAEFLSVVQ